MNTPVVRSGSLTYPRPTQTPEKTISPGAPSGTSDRCSSTTYTCTLLMGGPSGTRSWSGTRYITSWLVSSEVSVSPYVLTSLTCGSAANQRCTSSFFTASPVTDTH